MLTRLPTIKSMVGYGYSNYHIMQAAGKAAECVAHYARANGYSRDDILSAYAETAFDRDVRSMASRMIFPPHT